MATNPTLERFHQADFLRRHGDLEESLKLLVECVVEAPTDVSYAEALLDSIRAKFGSHENRDINTEPLPKNLERAISAQHWKDVIRFSARVLLDNPTHRNTLFAVCDACHQQDLLELEAVYLTHGRWFASHDVDLLRRIGHTFAELREFDEAIASWQQVDALNPDDTEAQRQLARLTIERCRDRAGLEAFFGDDASQTNRSKPRRVFARKKAGTSTTTDNILGEFSSVNSKMRQLTVQQLEAALRETPSNPENYLRLAVNYIEKGREYDAERLLARGRSETGDDTRIRHLWEHTTLMRLGARVGLAQREVDIKDTEETRAELAALQREFDQLEAEVFSHRAERNPNDSALHYELGVRLRKAANPRGAIIHLKEAIRERSQTCAAAYELGECLLEIAETKDALHYFRVAAEAPCEVEQLEFKSKALYRAAETVAKSRMIRLAVRYLNALLGMQPSHRDGAKLLAELQAQAS